jgi:hypothetical protein
MNTTKTDRHQGKGSWHMVTGQVEVGVNKLGRSFVLFEAQLPCSADLNIH